MKVVFLIGSLRAGGAERVISTLANEFAMRNIEVTIVTVTKECVYHLHKNIQTVSIYQINEIKTTYKNKVYRRLVFYPRLFRLIKKENPSVIIPFLQGMNANGILVAKLLGVPVIASEHGLFLVKGHLFSHFERKWIYRFADAVTVLTDNDFQQYHKFLNNVFIMQNPVSFQSVKEVCSRDQTILSVGSLSRWYGKGFDNLIMIFSNISPLYPEWRLQIAGDGEEGKKKLIQIAEEYEILDKIDFLGFVSDIEELMQKSSIFILSSRFEGFGMVLIEAMSQGCVSISFDCITGPAEIIQNKVDGILVEDQNMQQMKNEIIGLIEDQKLRKKLALNAIKNVDRFSIQLIADRWIHLINTVIKKS